MSGIIGIWNRDGTPVDLERLLDSIKTLNTSPGEDTGFLLVNTISGDIELHPNSTSHELFAFSNRWFNLAFACSQPASNDLGFKGYQPVTDRQQQLYSVYDGELYNTDELKRHFSLEDGTEADLFHRAFTHKGVESLTNLNGLFAVAFWNMSKGELTLVRDHVGGRSLYYSRRGDRFIFSSHIKAMLAGQWIDARACHWAIRQFLDVRCPAMTQTWYNGVHRLMSGTCVSVTREELRTGRYWHADYSSDSKIPEDEYIEQLRHEIVTAVRRRYSDSERTCAHLSGGVDSSTVVSVLGSLSGENNLQTYSGHYQGYIGDDRYDETDDARQVAESAGARQKIVVVDFDNMQEVLPGVIHLLEEPYAVGSYSQYCVFNETGKDNYHVVFCGEGGDELFAGYAGRHTEAALLDNLTPLPNPSGLFRAGWRTDDLRMKSLLLRFYPFKPWHQSRLRKRHDAPFNRDFLETMKPSQGRFTTHPRPRTHLARELVMDYGVELSYLMQMEHQLAARFGMCIRSPLTDPNIVRLAHKMPVRMLLRGTTTKYSLRRAAEKYVPHEVIWRKKKMGFTPPIVHGLRSDNVSNYCRELLTSRSAPEFFDRKYLNDVIDQHLSEQTNHETLLWRMMYISEWSRVFKVTL